MKKATTFGEFIKNRRIELGLTLCKAAKAADIDVVDWSKMERGVNSAPLNHQRIDSLMKTLNLTLEPNTEIWSLFITSALSKTPPITEEVIELSMPIFIKLSNKQKKALRPLIIESLTRNQKF